MKTNQKNYGITLISLIVTIIILLILAGISIGLILGSDGILGRATASVDKTNIEVAKEQVTLKIGEYQSEFYEGKYVNQIIDNASQQGDWIFENYGQRDLKVKDYEFLIELPESGVANKENSYKVTIKKNRRLPAKVTGTLSVDGILEWDENVVADSGDEEKGVVKVTAAVSYVGTSSCTIDVNATTTVGSIANYQYKVNDKIVQETTANRCTIKKLEPNSTYTIAVTAIDENGNSDTASVEATTQERTYIIKNGVQQYVSQTELINTTVAQENDYLKLTMGPTTQRCFYLVPFDTTNYTKIFLDAEIKKQDVTSADTVSAMGAAEATTDWLNGTFKKLGERIIVNATGPGSVSVGRACYEVPLDLTARECYVYIARWALSNSVGATIHVYNLWLEK